MSVFESNLCLVFLFYCLPRLSYPCLFVFLSRTYPLTRVERRKYLAAEGYIASDLAGVLTRKLKRKNIIARTDAGVGDTTVDLDNVDVVGDSVATPQAGLPHPKKAKTGKGVESGRTRPTNVRGGKDDAAGSTSLNAQVVESF